MATVSEKLLTAREFSSLPDPGDGARQELVRGVVVTMPPPKGPHGQCCANIAAILWHFVRQHKLGRVLSNDTGLLTGTNPDTVRGADILYWSYQRLPSLPEDVYISVPADLAVEVRSPSNDDGDMHEKVVEYLEAGVALVWVVDPRERTVTIYRTAAEGRVLHETATLTGEDVLPGFSCPVADFFVDCP